MQLPTKKVILFSFLPVVVIRGCAGYYLSFLANTDQAFLQMSSSDFFDIQEEMAVK